MKAVLILNRGGGSAGDDGADKAMAALVKAGIDSELIQPEGPKLEKATRRAVEDGATLVIAAGGDGTMSAVSGALAGTKAVMGLLPMGTLNHLARDLGIPFELDDAAKLIAAGKTTSIDLAEVNGRTFVNNSAVGLYPLMVRDREGQQERLGRSKKLAMLVASVRSLVRFHHHRLTLCSESGSAPVLTPLLFVGNNDYRTDIGAAGKRETVTGGALSVMVLKSRSRLGLFRAAIRALFNRARAEDMTKLDNVTELRVEARRASLDVSLDGEVVSLKTPLDYRIRPKALNIIVP